MIAAATIAPTRSGQVLTAIQRMIAERRASIDAAADIAEITIRVRVQPGATYVRGTQYSEERVMRIRDQR